MQAFVDKPKQWDAWNVDANFIEHHTDLLQADEVKLIENTRLRILEADKAKKDKMKELMDRATTAMAESKYAEAEMKDVNAVGVELSELHATPCL